MIKEIIQKKIVKNKFEIIKLYKGICFYRPLVKYEEKNENNKYLKMN